MFDPEQKLIILGIIAAAIVIICSAFAFALMRIGTHAFTGGAARSAAGLWPVLPRIATNYNNSIYSGVGRWFGRNWRRERRSLYGAPGINSRIYSWWAINATQRCGSQRFSQSRRIILTYQTAWCARSPPKNFDKFR